MHGVLINGTTGEWFSQTPDERRQVAETAIEQVAGRVDRRRSAARATRRGRRSSSRRHAVAAGADGIESTPPPYAKTFPDEIVALLPGHLATAIDAPLDGLQLAARRRASTSRPTSPSGSRPIDNVVAIKDSTPNLDQFFETAKTRRRGAAGLRPVHERRRARAPARARRRRVHRRRDALRRARRGVLGGALARATTASRARTRGAPTSSSRSSGSPAAGAGSTAAYQSQLKAIMKMLGQPGGEVRRPRLPVTDAGEPARDARDPRRGRAAAGAGGGGMSTFRGVDHVGVGVGDMEAAHRVLRAERRLRRVRFDYTGDAAGARGDRRRAAAARVAMLESAVRRRSGPARSSSCRCSTATGRRRSRRAAAWGELGVCEICLHVRGVQEVHDALVAAGRASLMEPTERRCAAERCHARHRLRRRSVGGKLELIEWTGLWRSLPGPRARRGREPRRVRRHRHGADARVLRAARVHRAAVRVGRVLRSDGAVVRSPWYDPAASRAAHDDADARAGGGDRARRARPAGPRLPRRRGATSGRWTSGSALPTSTPP